MARETSRRDFLRGRAAASAVGDALDNALAGAADGSASTAPSGGMTLRVSRRAMACQFEVCLNAGQYPHGEEAALRALDAVESLEAQLSFFRPGSELSQINALAAEQPVAVEPRLFELLQLAAAVSRETDGAFDLTAAPLWELWGFSRRAGAVPRPEQIAAALELVGGRWVELDATQRTVRLARLGVRLNLGAIGKGYALDRCAESLRAEGLNDFLLSGGFSSMLAAGSLWTGEAATLARRTATPGRFAGQECPAYFAKPTDVPSPVLPAAASPPRGWSVGVRNPLRPDRRLGELRLRDGALATSGSYVQSFRFGGKRYGHILDPRSGWPADGVLSATVLAPTAALADALSTAFYVLGLERTRQFCAARPEIGAILVCPARGSGGLAIHAIGPAVERFAAPVQP